MQLISFIESSRERIGLLKDAEVIDLSQTSPTLPTDMLSFLQAGDKAMNIARAAQSEQAHFQLADVELASVIKRPPKIIAIGLNYRAHAIESKMEIPKTPFVFTKQSTSATGPYSDIYWSEESKMLDYEGELAVVISRNCRRVKAADAADVIAGYTVLNDVSVRDWQLRGNPASFTMGKSWDTHCPMGPAIVTPDEITDPHNLQLKTYVNDELRQDTNTNDLIFNSYELIEFLSTAFTLEAGDIIATGTPSGVGFAMKPPQPLKPGDSVRVEIEGLGCIINSVKHDPAVG